MKLKKYNLQQLQDAVKNSDSIRECLIRLNVEPFGGNYDVFRKAVSFYKIDCSHFNGAAASGKKLMGRVGPNSISLEDILSNKLPCSSNRLRLKLLKAGVMQPRCSCCGGIEWLGSLIPLELDHIDGNNKNNSIENLRLLCPNCHALTPTYRGKNKKISPA